MRWVHVALASAVLVAAAAPPAGARSAGAPPRFASARPVAPLPGDGAIGELETGDLNGDGLSDVAITHLTYPPAPVAHPLEILLADGKGGFADGSSIWEGAPPGIQWARQIVI